MFYSRMNFQDIFWKNIFMGKFYRIFIWLNDLRSSRDQYNHTYFIKVYMFVVISTSITDVGNLIYYYTFTRINDLKPFLLFYWVKILNPSSIVWSFEKNHLKTIKTWLPIKKVLRTARPRNFHKCFTRD